MRRKSKRLINAKEKKSTNSKQHFTKKSVQLESTSDQEEEDQERKYLKYVSKEKKLNLQNSIDEEDIIARNTISTSSNTTNSNSSCSNTNEILDESNSAASCSSSSGSSTANIASSNVNVSRVICLPNNENDTISSLNNKTYLFLELKLMSIDKKCTYTPLTNRFLCIEAKACISHVKKFLASNMAIAESLFDIVVMSHGFEVNDDCPLMYLQNKFFNKKETILLYYIVIERTFKKSHSIESTTSTSSSS